MMLQKKTYKNIIQIDHKFLIIHTEYIIIGVFGSGKTNSLKFKKIYLLYAKDPYEAKYQLLINKRKGAGLKHLNNSKGFIEYSNDMDYIYKNIEKYSPGKERKISIVFDDVIADKVSNKKLNSNSN